MKFRPQKQEEISVNLTPLIDVVFLLLIFFMISTTFTRESQLQVDLPEAEAGASASISQALEILITARGEYSVNGVALGTTGAEALRQALLAQIGSDRTAPLVIAADARTPHQAVVTAMDVVGRLGFTQLSIITRQESE